MKNLCLFGCSKYSITHDGKVFSSYSNKFLSQKVDKDGYKSVRLTADDGSIKDLRVHRLVAALYCSGYDEALVVNHKDGVKDNNHYTNLEWTTVSQNSKHAIENKLQTEAGGYDITEISLVHAICHYLEQGFQPSEIETILNVERRKITEIRNKTYFSFISDEYNIDYVKKKHRIGLSKVIKICELLQDGKTLTAVANECGVGVSTVHRIRKRVIYSDISSSYKW